MMGRKNPFIPVVFGGGQGSVQATPVLLYQLLQAMCSWSWHCAQLHRHAGAGLGLWVLRQEIVMLQHTHTVCKWLLPTLWRKKKKKKGVCDGQKVCILLAVYSTCITRTIWFVIDICSAISFCSENSHDVSGQPAGGVPEPGQWRFHTAAEQADVSVWLGHRLLRHFLHLHRWVSVAASGFRPELNIIAGWEGKTSFYKGL